MRQRRHSVRCRTGERGVSVREGVVGPDEVIAGAFIAQRPVDQDEARAVGQVRRDPAGGGDTQQKAASGREHLLCRRNSEGSADRAADDANRHTFRPVPNNRVTSRHLRPQNLV